MSDRDPLALIARYRVVPVIAIDSVDQALPLVDALIAGGLPIVEITFRTKAALEVIRLLASERPGLLVGAGTVLDPATVEAAGGICGPWRGGGSIQPRRGGAARPDTQTRRETRSLARQAAGWGVIRVRSCLLTVVPER